MKRTLFDALCVLLLLCAILCSCQETKKESFFDCAFSAELRWERDGLIICALLEAKPPTSDGSARDLTLTFSEPPSLSGLTVQRQSGTLALIRDGMRIDDCTGIDGLLYAAELLFESGITVTLDSSGMPVAVESGGKRVTVIRYKKTE